MVEKTLKPQQVRQNVTSHTSHRRASSTNTVATAAATTTATVTIATTGITTAATIKGTRCDPLYPEATHAGGVSEQARTGLDLSRACGVPGGQCARVALPLGRRGHSCGSCARPEGIRDVRRLPFLETLQIPWLTQR